MSVTFLIGNGFDIGLGLKSKYADFYEHYVKNPTRSEVSNLKTKLEEYLMEKDPNNQVLQEDHERREIDWADFEYAFGQYSREFDEDTREKYRAEFRDFQREFYRYLEDEESKIDYDDKAIADMMHEAMSNFYQVLAKEEKEDVHRVYNALTKYVKINFVCFNYTKVLDRCVEAYSQSEKGKNAPTWRMGNIVHVHGYLNESAIVGLNDISQIANEKIAADVEFCREFIKPEMNRIIKRGYASAARSVIRDSSIICIYGMSMGETDKIWWKEIAAWLGLNDRRRLIIFDYDPKFERGMNYAWLDKQDQVKKRFFMQSECNAEQKKKIAERIYVVPNKTIFKINADENSGTAQNGASESIREYNDIRKRTAKALVNYADVLSHPIDIAKSNGVLPPAYLDAQKNLRELASEFGALHAMATEDNLPIPLDLINEAKRNLIGLSNSLSTPYGQGVSSEMLRQTQEMENELRTLLSLKQE